MNHKARELLRSNKKVKRKIGEYIIRLKENRQELRHLQLKTARLQEEIQLYSKKMAMEELRIKEDIDRLVEILNHCYEVEEA